MMGLGLVAALAAAWILWATRRGGTPQGRWILASAVSLPFLPLLANSFGWIFTEMGRQPWAVFGLMTTERAVSPGVSVTEAAVSLVVLTLVYAVLAVIEVRLMLTYAGAGAEPFVEPEGRSDDPDRPLAFAY
jgi:cytochrome d ubiquinol oxidase subunit I